MPTYLQELVKLHLRGTVSLHGPSWGELLTAVGSLENTQIYVFVVHGDVYFCAECLSRTTQSNLVEVWRKSGQLELDKYTIGRVPFNISPLPSVSRTNTQIRKYTNMHTLDKYIIGWMPSVSRTAMHKYIAGLVKACLNFVS